VFIEDAAGWRYLDASANAGVVAIGATRARRSRKASASRRAW